MQMEITKTWVGIAIVAVAILTWAWRVLNWVWLTPKKLERCLRQQGFTGNSYRFWYGDLKESTKMSREALSKPISFSNDIVPRVLPFIHQAVKNYGKNTFTWMGPTPKVTITDPELLKNIFSNTSNFQKQKPNQFLKLLATGIASYEHEKWATHRRIINPAFHLEKLKHMLPAFYFSSSEMLRNWEKLVSKDGSWELDVCPYLQNMTSDVISRTAFGSSYMEGSRIFQLLKEQASLVIQAVQSTYIPGWRFLPTTNNKRMKEIDKEIRVSLTGIIKKRENAIKAGEAANDDLLGLLMESNVKEINEHGNNKNMGMSTRDVIEECKLFYFAGQETTSALLVWTMILLSKHQEWQTLAREEVIQAFGNDTPNFEGLNHLKIVTMIFYEVLRLYPPLVAVNRAVNKETKLGKFVLPAGVIVSLPMILVQQDHELWGEDALEFKPERFSEGVSKATKNQISFFPFGGGPRICIGQNFAMIEAKMALAMIIQRFSFELSPSYAHAPHSVIILQPQYGAHIILHKL